jgi:hypothetical protein
MVEGKYTTQVIKDLLSFPHLLREYLHRSSGHQPLPLIILPNAIRPVILILHLIANDKRQTRHPSTYHEHKPVPKTKRNPVYEQ